MLTVKFIKHVRKNVDNAKAKFYGRHARLKNIYFLVFGTGLKNAAMRLCALTNVRS
jgi:hypothetical protein